MDGPTLFDQDDAGEFTHGNVISLNARRPIEAEITEDEYQALMRAAAQAYRGETPEPVRVAALSRGTDPETSRQAAASISGAKMRETQRVIVEILDRFGPACDEDIAVYATQLASLDQAPKQSPSGLRSRRAELVTAGIVRDSGDRTKTSSGRQTIVWELAKGAW